MILFFIVFFTTFSSINYYVYKRGLQALELIPKWGKQVYKTLFLVFALSYVTARSVFSSFSDLLYDFFLYLGSLWFALLVYVILFILLFEIIRLTNKLYKFLPEKKSPMYLRLKLVALCFTIFVSGLVVGYGLINAKNIHVNKIELSLPKKQSSLTSLNIAFFSDSHLSTINDGRFTSEIVDKVNQLKPDIILLGGDIVDDNSKHLLRYKIDKKLKELYAPLGIYTCNGNHEWIVGEADAASFFRKSGINVLVDTVFVIDGIIQIVSREDRTIARYTEKNRKPLNKLMIKADRNLPTILLDHQPFNLEEAVNNNIDLQLSGHTHNGQFFPGNIITKLVYELSYGYLKKGNTHYYVSSGVGTWGPPVKIISPAEIVNFKIKFK
jgi:hypothetical protein